MSKRLRVILVVLLAIPLVFLLRGFVRNLLLGEVLRGLWAIRTLFESLPQEMLWQFLLLTVLLVAAANLFKSFGPAPERPERPIGTQGQVALLADWVQKAGESGYLSWLLATHLSRLIWDLLAYRGRTTPEALRKRLRADTLDLPAEVIACLEVAQINRLHMPKNLLARFWGRRRGNPAAPPPEFIVEKVVQFLESELEISHEP